MAPSNPHPHGTAPINLVVTQEELFVIRCGIERMADIEDGEFAYIREIAGNLALPQGCVTYANMKV